MGQRQGSDLLLFLESRLLSDRQLPGFSGTVAIGVRSAGSAPLWWNASFGATAEHGIAAARAGDPDVEILLDDEEAVAVLEGNASGIDPDRVVGDRSLLRRFLQRYLHVTNTLDIRLNR